MPYGPAQPADHSDMNSQVMRSQLNALNDKPDATPAGPPGSQGAQGLTESNREVARSLLPDVGIHHDAPSVHGPVWMKRLWFSAHHCALPVSAIVSASAWVIALRRVADSRRSQLSTSSNWEGSNSPVGMVARMPAGVEMQMGIRGTAGVPRRKTSSPGLCLCYLMANQSAEIPARCSPTPIP